MTSDQIVALLAFRHAGDIFVTECKTGPSQGYAHSRLDAWAALKSWAHPCCFGYEVKVSRGDFLKDDKWRAYLPLCNQFYFVCPPGVINPDEVPQDAGLLHVSKNCAMLYTKKKAPHRSMKKPPADLLWYILYSRAKIVRDYMVGDGENRRGTLREWVQQKADGQELSYLVHQRIHRIVDAVKNENKQLKDESERYADIRNMMTEMGITPSRWRGRYEVEKILRAIPGVDELVQALADAHGCTATAIKQLSALQAEAQKGA
jgi:hypothetical protein